MCVVELVDVVEFGVELEVFYVFYVVSDVCVVCMVVY